MGQSKADKNTSIRSVPDRKVLVQLYPLIGSSPTMRHGQMAQNAGVAKWLKAQGLGPCHEGVRGFDSRPPH
jgi:hypothetical protein